MAVDEATQKSSSYGGYFFIRKTTNRHYVFFFIRFLTSTEQNSAWFEIRGGKMVSATGAMGQKGEEGHRPREDQP